MSENSTNSSKPSETPISTYNPLLKHANVQGVQFTTNSSAFTHPIGIGLGPRLGVAPRAAPTQMTTASENSKGNLPYEFYQGARVTNKTFHQGDWALQSRTGGLLPAANFNSVSEQIEKELNGMDNTPLPGAVYMSGLTLLHKPSGLVVQFSAPACFLGCVYDFTFPDVPAALKGEETRNVPLVEAATKWKAASEKKREELRLQVNEMEVFSDWTFSCMYWGSVALGGREEFLKEYMNKANVYTPSVTDQPCDALLPIPVPTSTAETTELETANGFKLIVEEMDTFDLPVALLTERIPINFFSSCDCFEDDLGDNGVSRYEIKSRITDKYIFLLARQDVRVDRVCFRQIDTKIFISLEGGSDKLEVYRHFVIKHCSYQDIQKKHNLNLSGANLGMHVNDSERRAGTHLLTDDDIVFSKAHKFTLHK